MTSLKWVQSLLNQSAAPCLRSTNTNPFWNLAFEDWLCTHTQFTTNQQRLLLLYQNEPTVVLGRGQNPFTQCQVEKISVDGVHLIRRSSGGGSVYHDLGNVNCSFLTHRSVFSRDRFANSVAAALREVMAVDAFVSSRHNVMASQGKLSGSAFRVTTKNAYHHFTMLVDSQLDHLEQYLKPVLPGHQVDSRGVESVREKVVNLAQINPDIHPEKFIALAAWANVKEMEGFLSLENSQLGRSTTVAFTENLVTEFDPADIPEVAEAAKMLKSWNYVFGQTPAFSHHLQVSIPNEPPFTLTLDVENGRVRDLIPSKSTPLTLDLAWLHQLRSVLRGCKYQRTALAHAGLDDRLLDQIPEYALDQ